MPRMTPYSSLQAPPPGDIPAGVTTLRATADNGLRFSARNVDGGRAHYWLLRQATDSGIWTKTAYGAMLDGVGTDCEVHLPCGAGGADDGRGVGPVQVGELWAVMTDRAPGSNDLVYLSLMGRAVNLAGLNY